MHSLTTSQIENVRLWINALRSGKFKQTTGALHNICGLDVMGVACRVLKLKLNLMTYVLKHTNGFLVAYDHSIDTFPPRVAKALGIRSSSGEMIVDGINISLITLNDSRQQTFDQMANIIEENLKTNINNLFV